MASNDAKGFASATRRRAASRGRRVASRSTTSAIAAKLVVELKGPTDYVTHADRDVENVIRRELAAAFPDDAFLGEETAAQFTGPVDRCWVVDPIDGTHNFLRGVPYWNVAIGYVENGRTEIGVVCDPPADALLPRAARPWRVVQRRPMGRRACTRPRRSSWPAPTSRWAITTARSSRAISRFGDG